MDIKRTLAPVLTVTVVVGATLASGLMASPTAAVSAIASAAAPAVAPAQVGGARPNIVVMQTDDQIVSDLSVMPTVRKKLEARGVKFNQMVTPFPICCPSRAAQLTGSYPHNNGVQANFPPDGGYVPWEKKSGDKHIGKWLQNAGYHTVHIGKYINGYAFGNRRNVPVPTGWSEWYGSADPSTYQMWGYRLNEPTGSKKYGKFPIENPRKYSTDIYGKKAVKVVRKQAQAPGPFYMQVAFLAPHVETVPFKKGFVPQSWADVDNPDPSTGISTIPPRPAPRDRNRFNNMPLKRDPSFNEKNVKDKGEFVRDLPLLSQAEIQDMVEDNRQRRRSLLAVDKAVGSIVKELKKTGQLDNTIVVMMGDNGYLLGQHRISMGKYFAYEPALKIPFIMRGPGVKEGAKVGQLSSLVDITPTLLDFAGVAPTGREPDGLSLRPVVTGSGDTPVRPVLLSSGPQKGPNGEFLPLYDGVRTPRFAWWRFEDGFEEMYDLKRDPYELTNVAKKAKYKSIRDALASEWDRLKNCSAASCQVPMSSIPGVPD